MNLIARHKVMASMLVALEVALLVQRCGRDLVGCVGNPRLDMPISLAEGVVTTPSFPVKHGAYVIIIRAQGNKGVSLDDLGCMMAVMLPSKKCAEESGLEAEWTGLG